MKRSVNAKRLWAVIAVVIASAVLFELGLYLGQDWIIPAYITIGTFAVCAYMIIMRGVLTPPSKTVFSADLPEEERQRLTEQHRKNFQFARPFLYVIIAVIGAFLVDGLYMLGMYIAEKWIINGIK